MSEITAYELESYIIPHDLVDSLAPKEALEVYHQGVKEGIPSAIAHHHKYGWFVLMTGQGPMIAWSQDGRDEEIR